MDLKDKLNKNDLKKNNLSINKKIDKLENKISKTLVDTIIYDAIMNHNADEINIFALDFGSEALKIYKKADFKRIKNRRRLAPTILLALGDPSRS